MTDPGTGATPFDVLLDRLRQGDEDAARELIDRYGDAVRREIRFRLRDSRLHRVVGDSDVFQSAVSRFIWGLRLGKFDVTSPQELLGLLRTIAERRVCRAARFWQAQRRDMQRTGDLADVSDTALIAADPTPSKAVSEKELIAETLARLPEAGPADGPVAAGRAGMGGNRPAARRDGDGRIRAETVRAGPREGGGRTGDRGFLLSRGRSLAHYGNATTNHTNDTNERKDA